MRALATVALFVCVSALGEIKIIGDCGLVVGTAVTRPERSAKIHQPSLDRYAAEWPEPIRPLGEIIAANIRHLTQADLETSVQGATIEILKELPKDSSPITFWGRVDRSSWWIALLIHEFLTQRLSAELRPLIASRPVFFYEHDYSDDLLTYLREHPEAHFIAGEDASYSGAQAKNILRSFGRAHNPAQVHMALGRITQKTLDDLTGEFPLSEIRHGGKMPTLGEILKGKPELIAMANRVLAHKWQDRVLTYWDHTIADDQSTVAIRGGALVLAGAVPNPDGSLRGFVQFQESRPVKPY